jgi:hypothetical protein
VRISFDLDDTLICYDDEVAQEPRITMFRRFIVHDEPLRAGARELMRTLQSRGHEIWIYTSSGRRARWIRRWLRYHGVRVDCIVDGARHAKCFGEGSLPTKRPHAFGIHLHVNDSRGVAVEGERYGFNVCLLECNANGWVQQVLDAVASHQRVLSPK